jgi:hypothetical protein
MTSVLTQLFLSLNALLRASINCLNAGIKSIDRSLPFTGCSQ